MRYPTLPWLLACAGAVATTPLAAQSLSEADSLLASNDTTGAIAVLERLVKHRLDDAEAHYRAGMLYLSRHEAGTDLSPNRRKAEEHLRYATRFAPDSAQYWLGLADALRSEDLVTTRVQVGGIVDNAVAAAERTGRPEIIARAAYRRAQVAWEQYDEFDRRYVSRTINDQFMERGMEDINAPVTLPSPLAEWKDVERFFTENVQAIHGSGAEYRDALETGLRQVLGATPAHIGAAGLLVVALGDGNRWEEAAAVARRLVRAVPDSGRAWALQGLVLARRARWKEAQTAFDTAFARMTPAQQAPYRNIMQLMREGDQLRVARVDSSARPAFDSLYWFAAQPLALTPTNEARTEFYARLAYAEHRWGDPWRGYLGHETNMGVAFVRYGPPDVWAKFDRSITAWVYLRARFYFLFQQAPGFTRAHFAPESEERFAIAERASPARFDNVPILRTLDTILVQTAQFRGPEDTTALIVFGAIPLGRMAEASPVRGLPLTSGAIVTNQAGHEVARSRRDERLSGGADTGDLLYRTWRLAVRPGSYFLRAEAVLAALNRGARGAGVVPVRAIPRRGLALSDLLVAGRVEPRDTNATRWDEFLIEPNAGRFTPGTPVGLLWEIYNLTPDSSGTAGYEVELRIQVEAIERRSTVAAIVGGIADAMGISAVGEDRVRLRYRASADAAHAPAHAEYLTLDLKNAPPGRYTIEVWVRAGATGEEATATRTFTVGESPVER